MKERVSLLVFEGGDTGTSEIEQATASVRRAITLDNLERFTREGLPLDATLVTNHEGLAREAREVAAGRFEVELEKPGSDRPPFHLGERLSAWAARNPERAVVYMGGASGCVLAARELGRLAEELRRASLAGKPELVSNNMLSSDILGAWPASMLVEARNALPRDDNGLALAIQAVCGVGVREMPESVGTRFDVDTPTDAVILHLHPCAGPRVCRVVRHHVSGVFARTLGAVERARAVLTRDFSDVVLAGRVSPATVSAINRTLKTRLRVYSEERGMKALGRIGRARDGLPVTSLLGMIYDLVGPSGFFERLARLCQAAFIDTRVLFAHSGLEPCRADRFWSDAGCPEEVGDPFVKEFTEAAREATIPVVLGGHSLVCGGVRALAGERGEREREEEEEEDEKR